MSTPTTALQALPSNLTQTDIAQCYREATGATRFSETDEIFARLIERRVHELAALSAPAQDAPPIDMVLHCPACGRQHIDAREYQHGDHTAQNEHAAWEWNNPPHRSHLCHGCGHIWRPADVPTNGVEAVKTKGKADSPIGGCAAPAAPAQDAQADKRAAFEAWQKEYLGPLPATPIDVMPQWLSAVLDELPQQQRNQGQREIAARLVADIRAAARTQPTPVAQDAQAGPPDLKDALVEHLCDNTLVSVYDCTRVWEAWQVGTMSEDDFVPCSERADQIADDLIAFFAARAQPATPAQDAAMLDAIITGTGITITHIPSSEVRAQDAAATVPLQGGLSNAELLAAWQQKLPGVTPSERDLCAFALGVEVGFATPQAAPQAVARQRQAWPHDASDRVHDLIGKLAAKELECQRLREAARSVATPPAAPQTRSLPERDTTKPAEQQGLFRKFEVRRTDGSDQPGGKHCGCEYFVLDTDHDPAARAALTAYADAIEATHKPLADDLRVRYGLMSAQPAGMVPLTEHHKLDNDQQVFFYEQDFYVLSNFSSFNLEWQGLTFPTSEHAYHWEKFNIDGAAQAECRKVFLTARSAHDAFKAATELKQYRRADWDDVKVGIMRDILRAKAQQHEYVRRKLLATGDRELIEDSWRDDYWGWGPNRDGQNMLGKLWMEVRAELRDGITPTTKEQQ